MYRFVIFGLLAMMFCGCKNNKSSYLSPCLEIRGLLYIENKWIVLDRIAIYRKDQDTYHVVKEQFPLADLNAGVSCSLHTVKNEIDICYLKYKQIVSIVKICSQNCDRCEFLNVIDLSWDYIPDADKLSQVDNVLYGCGDYGV